jgi:hypothetical protein
MSEHDEAVTPEPERAEAEAPDAEAAEVPAAAAPPLEERIDDATTSMLEVAELIREAMHRIARLETTIAPPPPPAPAPPPPPPPDLSPLRQAGEEHGKKLDALDARIGTLASSFAPVREQLARLASNMDARLNDIPASTDMAAAVRAHVEELFAPLPRIDERLASLQSEEDLIERNRLWMSVVTDHLSRLETKLDAREPARAPEVAAPDPSADAAQRAVAAHVERLAQVARELSDATGGLGAMWDRLAQIESALADVRVQQAQIVAAQRFAVAAEQDAIDYIEIADEPDTGFARDADHDADHHDPDHDADHHDTARDDADADRDRAHRERAGLGRLFSRARRHEPESLVTSEPITLDVDADPFAGADPQDFVIDAPPAEVAQNGAEPPPGAAGYGGETAGDDAERELLQQEATWLADAIATEPQTPDEPVAPARATPRATPRAKPASARTKTTKRSASARSNNTAKRAARSAAKSRASASKARSGSAKADRGKNPKKVSGRSNASARASRAVRTDATASRATTSRNASARTQRARARTTAKRSAARSKRAR